MCHTRMINAMVSNDNNSIQAATHSQAAIVEQSTRLQKPTKFMFLIPYARSCDFTPHASRQHRA